jgi:hypothetical protein
MPAGEEETVFSTKVKYNGIFNFPEFYRFCYDWLKDDMNLDIAEKKYSEKIKGDAKDIEIEWEGTKTVTDYFKNKVKVTYRIIGLTKVDVMQGNAKVSTNKGSVEIGVKGILMRDYEGKMERTAFQKFLRGIYDKWVIPARIKEFEERVIMSCDNFLGQAKAWLDLEGKR